MTTKNKKGFTIIEVVLVLAIAGLIFLMVFIALPALQRSQRNTQRENDIARFLTAINDYQTNNSGRTPFSASTSGEGASAVTTTSLDANFIKRYIDQGITYDTTNGVSCTAESCPQFTDPDGELYDFVISQSSDTSSGAQNFPGYDNTDVDHHVYVIINATCGQSEGTYLQGTGNRQIALFYSLEGGSSTCNDNH